MRGFFAADDSVRAGYEAIRSTVHLDSSASEERLALLRTAFNAHCPVPDIIAKAVPVELELKITQSPVKAAA